MFLRGLRLSDVNRVGVRVVSGSPEAQIASTGFRWLVLATSVATYVLIVLGGVVRTTGSGDACPDWPRCHGQIVPPLETGVLIEFSHRLLASVVGFLVLAVAIAAWRSRQRAPMIAWAAMAALALLVGQVILGGVTVLNGLPSSMVMAHLAVASALLAILLVIAVAPAHGLVAGDPRGRELLVWFRNLALFGAVALFLLMMTGAYLRGTGAALAFRDWPLFDGRLLPDGGRLAVIHATHRLAALAVGLLLTYIAVRAWRRLHWRQPIVLGMALVMVLYVAQALVGAANIWTLLQPAAAAAHLALAVAIWATLVVVAIYANGMALSAMEVEKEAMTGRSGAAALGTPAAVATRRPSQ